MNINKRILNKISKCYYEILKFNLLTFKHKIKQDMQVATGVNSRDLYNV